ncbi:zinc finger CCCH domain-containing protein 6-like [Gastrolobium bilobum]|uniref:zinc finger CCCH domain-containing protein 6-like n=1 Tax=Gastrolobium bilobum TaxID=150636 RepID=UPI002AB1C352|nr:zinc finger CCCH domain-containing protein 6-like [Gastrolobium bilobum]
MSEDYPSKVGQKSQDHRQAKTTSVLHSSANEPDDLPLGFESSHFLNQSKFKFSHISQMKWECPPPVILNSGWLVAAGEESREREVQKLREKRVLEAVYPRTSAIPPSPSVFWNVEEEEYDDNLTPLIPMIPIEERESLEISPELAVAANPAPNLQSQNLQQYMLAITPINSDCNASCTVSSDACAVPLSGISPDLAAASAVVAAINEQGSLIDMDLLVKILNDPKLIEKLINEQRTAPTTISASSNNRGIPTSGLKPAIPSVPLSTSARDAATSRITPTSTVVLLPSGLKPATPSVSLLNPSPDKPATLSVLAIPSGSLLSATNDKPAIASVPLSRPFPGKPSIPSGSLLSAIYDKPTTASVPLSRPVPGKPALPPVSKLSAMHDKPTTASVPLSRLVSGKPAIPSLRATHDKPATASVPLSRPVPGKPVTPVSFPTPPPAPHMHRPVNRNIHHISNGMPPALNKQPPQQDAVLASGVKRAASLASISSSELSSIPLPYTNGNLHSVFNQAQFSASITPYPLSTGSAFRVKDVNYYKNLIRRHGAADKQDMQNSQIGNHHSNFQDLKLEHNIKQGEAKLKIQKPCIYFNSSRGCRNGSNCLYQHDL